MVGRLGPLVPPPMAPNPSGSHMVLEASSLAVMKLVTKPSNGLGVNLISCAIYSRGSSLYSIGDLMALHVIHFHRKEGGMAAD